MKIIIRFFFLLLIANNLFAQEACSDEIIMRVKGKLEKPAFMKNTSYASSFSEFAGENEGNMLEQVNDNYFISKLPPHVPQFLVLYWHWNTEKPSLDFANQIQYNFNFKPLQAILINKFL